MQQARQIFLRSLAVLGLFLLPACANDSIWPNEPLPPAPAGPPPAFPSFVKPDTDAAGNPDTLTPIERQELEERLTKIAKDRERGVVRAIQKAK